MSDEKLGKKSKYESPILVPLGGVAKGSGICTSGSSVVLIVTCSSGAADSAVICSTGAGFEAPACSVGGADAASLHCTCGNTPLAGGTDCTAGLYASNDCSAGTSATRDCTAGVCATRACTQGSAAQSACTAGPTF